MENYLHLWRIMYDEKGVRYSHNHQHANREHDPMISEERISDVETHDGGGHEMAVGAADAVENAYRVFLETLQQTLPGLEPAVHAHLAIAVKALVRAGIEQKVLADRLKVSRTTIGRWYEGENLPRHEDFRATRLVKLREILDEHLDKYLASRGLARHGAPAP